MDEEQELRRDLWSWVHFCLHDADFIEALRSRYPQEAIDQAIADIEAWFTTYINAQCFLKKQKVLYSIIQSGYGVFLCK